MTIIKKIYQKKSYDKQMANYKILKIFLPQFCFFSFKVPQLFLILFFFGSLNFYSFCTSGFSSFYFSIFSTFASSYFSLFSLLQFSFILFFFFSLFILLVFPLLAIFYFFDSSNFSFLVLAFPPLYFFNFSSLDYSNF